jgi:Txe/YoeB family toxin of Txe-Axe toxin-antitoxin module
VVDKKKERQTDRKEERKKERMVVEIRRDPYMEVEADLTSMMLQI